MIQQYKFSTTIPMVFGQLFVIYRKRMNLTQKDLAEALGVGVANVSKIESGDTVISVEQLLIISLLFKERSSDLFIKFENALKILDKNGVLVGNSKVKELSIDKSTKIAAVSTAAIVAASSTGLGLIGPLALSIGAARLLPGIGIAATAYAAYKKYSELTEEEKAKSESIELPIIQGDQLYPYIVQTFS
ncbi:helix-turn-helix domain-containing protein [Acinetobacter modestus]|uniref:helix-turn-helix domain-containing protein n=1 Tax=Acinetobacter modestus TaxID=1776740 RepID=UPI00202E1B01|nr:helix-turn-helix transcriptional regulator [Acinetobacter modestus]